MHVQTCWQCGGKNRIEEDEQRGGPPVCGECGAELPTAADWQAVRQEHRPAPRAADYTELEAHAPASLVEKAKTFFCTYALIVANIVVFVVMVASGVHLVEPTTQSLFDWGADFGPRSVGPEPWRMLTSMFIHIGIIHLALNMYALSAIGPLTERLYGRAGFLALYLLSGVGGSVVSIAWSPSVVSAGASGAVFGLFGGLLGLLLTRRGAFPTGFVQHHTTSIIGFLGYNIFFGMTHPSINNAAHMGGLVTGVLMAIALSPDVTARRKWGVRQTVGTLLVLMLLAGGTVVAKRKVEESREAKLLSVVYSSSKLELKPGQEVFYTNLVTKDEAQTLAWYETLASQLSAKIFSDRPVTIHLCDGELVTRKTVSSKLLTSP